MSNPTPIKLSRAPPFIISRWRIKPLPITIALGGVATGIAYGLKLIVTACAVVWLGRALGADGTGLVVTLIVGEIVALCTMVAVVLKVEGPGFDIDES